MRRTATLLSYVVVSVGLSTDLWAQPVGPHQYSDAQVQSAVISGYANRNVEHGQALDDVASKWFQAFGEYAESQGQLKPGTGVSASGFRIIVYSPLNWVSRAAGRANHPLTTSEVVGTGLLRPVLRVVALPSSASSKATSGYGASPVVGVALIDATRRSRLLPDSIDAYPEGGPGAVMAEFGLAGVAQLQANGLEFRVRVVGQDGIEKDFVIKRKHWDRLALK